MKKKIFVIFLTACFLSAPLSAKAMMFDSMPKVNDDLKVQITELFEILETAIAFKRGEIELSNEETKDQLKRTYEIVCNGVPDSPLEIFDENIQRQAGLDTDLLFDFAVLYIGVLLFGYFFSETDLEISTFMQSIGMVVWYLILLWLIS